ncbi:hypothetical protein AX774_g2494 [Zancudomyces culisetae]|uniref:Uncharacterized protein n=1 Tax=Zancudomyces culisetae TaxID=1213189 RepID=A0A1R1PSW6_ZANCU|nr:hypothetical protein AX774_g2494 [Zancudomyces culisetae]|eukprot:OMH83993.1 hypothetical protein AX774_g2494 [Zancudomyces culisetae]
MLLFPIRIRGSVTNIAGFLPRFLTIPFPSPLFSAIPAFIECLPNDSAFANVDNGTSSLISDFLGRPRDFFPLPASTNDCPFCFLVSLPTGRFFSTNVGPPVPNPPPNSAARPLSVVPILSPIFIPGPLPNIPFVLFALPNTPPLLLKICCPSPLAINLFASLILLVSLSVFFGLPGFLALPSPPWLPWLLSLSLPLPLPSPLLLPCSFSNDRFDGLPTRRFTTGSPVPSTLLTFRGLPTGLFFPSSTPVFLISKLAFFVRSSNKLAPSGASPKSILSPFAGRPGFLFGCSSSVPPCACDCNCNCNCA